MPTERMVMKQPDTSPGSVASAADLPGETEGSSRLTSPSTAAGGEASTNRAAARFAWVLWALSVLLLLGYIPLRYLWHAVASTPGTALPPHYIALLKDTVPQVIGD